MTFIFITISLLFSAFFSGIETGHYTIDKVNFYYLVEQKDRRAIFLKKVMEDSQVFIFTILICNNIAVYIGSLFMTRYYTVVLGDKVEFLYGFIPWSAETAATITLLLPFFFFGEALPKNFFTSRSNILYSITWPLQIVVWIFKPITVPLKWLAKKLTNSDKDFGSELQNLSINKLCSFMSEGKSKGVISKAQNQMIENLINLRAVKVGEVCLLNEKIESLSLQSTNDEVLEFLHKHKINTILIHDNLSKDFVGSVKFFDLMEMVENDEKIADIMAEINSINLESNLQSAFKTMQYFGVDILKVTHNDSIKGLLKLKDIIKYITK